MADAQPLPVHLPTSDEAGAHLIERLNADGSAIVRDSTTGQLTTIRLGVDSITGNYWAVVSRRSRLRLRVDGSLAGRRVPLGPGCVMLARSGPLPTSRDNS
jgi:hypothetical protein